MHLKQNLIGCDRYSELPACGDGWRGRQNPIRSTGFHSTVWKCQPYIQWIVSSIIVQILESNDHGILFLNVLFFTPVCPCLFSAWLTLHAEIVQEWSTSTSQCMRTRQTQKSPRPTPQTSSLSTFSPSMIHPSHSLHTTENCCSWTISQSQ